MHTLFHRSVSLIVAIVLLLSVGFSSVTAHPDLYTNHNFLPMISNEMIYTVKGEVTTQDNIPVPGVEIITNDGKRTVTDQNGMYTLTELKNTEYTLIPNKDGYTFLPNTKTIGFPTSEIQVDFVTNLVACTDVIVNGGFETSTGWELPATLYTAAYSTARVHQGVRSLRTGITDLADNRYSYSSGRQSVTIPSGTISANLIFYIYPQSTETSNRLPPEVQAGETLEATTLSGDVQYVVVTDLAGTVLERLIWQQSNSLTWEGYSFDVTKFAGRTIQIHFGTYNDGYYGITSMYVDDVVLQLCPTTSPTPTPVPPTCGNLVLNESFETTSGWDIPITVYPAGYSTSYAHTGLRSMRTGITLPVDNRYSYSDAGQWFYIPWNAQAATLGLWIYPSTADSLYTVLPAIPLGMEFGTSTLSSDVQYLLVLDQYQNIIETLLWQRSNSQTWTYAEFNLLKYAGRTIKIQFGTYNDGYDGITSMHVDDVVLNTCITTPTPVPPPSPTPVPDCTEIILNGGLETTSAWYLPLTAYPAAYSTDRAYTGVRSMRTGITNPAANKYSYSDAAQTVTIPANATQAKLTFFAYTYSGELLAKPIPEIPTGMTFGDAVLANDVQYLLVLDQYQNWIDTLLWQRSNNQSWVGNTFDIKKYAGQTIILQFGTYNDGYDGITYMYFDEVSLQVCQP